ncbi:MAG: NAD-dependent deacylase [Bacteroidales bacterium]|nr:NAD-dependent deacylase [Bacteroidales bacterium]
MKKKIVVLSGAGVSAESGIRTFRDSNGLWEEYRVEDVASIDGWRRNKELVLDFYNQRRRALKDAEPNRAHEIIAELEEKYRVCVVTQNVDNLHERAGSKRVIHLHGELTKARSTKDEEKSYDIGYNDIHLGDMAPDGGQMRPFIVWFGESVPKLSEAAKEVQTADILIIIGTSLNVYPAAGLVNYTKPDCKIYLVDPQPMPLDMDNFTQIQEKATVGMEKIKEELF